MLNVSFAGFRKQFGLNRQQTQSNQGLTPQFKGNVLSNPEPELNLFNYHQGDTELQHLLQKIVKQGPDAHEALFKLFRDGIKGARLKAFAALEEIDNDPAKLVAAAHNDAQRARLAQKVAIQKAEPDFVVIA